MGGGKVGKLKQSPLSPMAKTRDFESRDGGSIPPRAVSLRIMVVQNNIAPYSIGLEDWL